MSKDKRKPLLTNAGAPPTKEVKEQSKEMGIPLFRKREEIEKVKPYKPKNNA